MDQLEVSKRQFKNKKDIEKLIDARDYVIEKKNKGIMFHEAKPDIKKIYIEVSSRCNLNCITCIRHSWSLEHQDMSLELFKEIVQQLDSFPNLKKVVIGGLGEPFMNPDIMKMTELIKNKGYEVKITTNGMLLNRSIFEKLISLNVDELVISIDSFQEEEFENIRKGGELKELKDKLLQLKDIKKEEKTIFPRVSMEFVLMESNRDQLSLLSEKARELGILNILVTNLLPYREEMTDEILYGQGEKDLDLPIKFWSTPIEGLSTMCTMDMPDMNWNADRQCDFINADACVITVAGEVAPCYALMHSYKYYIFGREKIVKSHSFGNIREKSLEDIWTSPDYVKFRDRIREFSFPSCQDCKINNNCSYARENQDCWGNIPSCADCLWAQSIVRCP